MTPLLCMILTTAVAAPPEPTPDPALAALVKQLGSKSFAVREAAARDLLKAGPKAVPSLTAGAAAAADPEVAERCKQLLSAAATAERTAKVADLLKNTSGPPPAGLPGLGRFLKITGDTKANRQLYAEMFNTHYAILGEMETNPSTGSQLLSMFIKDAITRWQGTPDAGRRNFDTLLASRGDAALFLFVRSDPRFVANTEHDYQTGYVVKAAKFKSAVAGPAAVPGMTALFLQWLQSEQDTNILEPAFQAIAEDTIKEALPVMLKMAADNRVSPANGAKALMTLTKLGTKVHLKDVAPLLADRREIWLLVHRNMQTQSTQVRDVALGVCVLLAGEKPADYGIDAKGNGGGSTMSPHFYGFADDASREAAHAKWRSRGTKPAGKSD